MSSSIDVQETQYRSSLYLHLHLITFSGLLPNLFAKVRYFKDVNNILSHALTNRAEE